MSIACIPHSAFRIPNSAVGRRSSVVGPLIFLLLSYGCDTTPKHPNTHTPTQNYESTPPAFKDVTDSVGIDFRHQNSHTPRKYLVESFGSGCAFIDFDGDGWLDILLLNNRLIPGGKVQGKSIPKLYRSERGKRFVDVTRSAGLDVELYAMGVTVGDYDNDGRDDFYVSC